MAQTRKTLNNKLAVATAQLAAVNHQTRRTLNERVKAAEAAQKQLDAKLTETLKHIAQLESEREALAARVLDLENQVNGDEA